jgi:ankyrin repeat protein
LTATVGESVFINDNTALHLAALCNRPAIVLALQEREVDVEALNVTGLTALQVAEVYQHQAVIDILSEPLTARFGGINI